MFARFLEFIKFVWKVVIYLLMIKLYLATGGLITRFSVVDICVRPIILFEDDFLGKDWLKLDELMLSSSVFSSLRFLIFKDCKGFWWKWIVWSLKPLSQEYWLHWIVSSWRTDFNEQLLNVRRPAYLFYVLSSMLMYAISKRNFKNCHSGFRITYKSIKSLSKGW